MGTRRISILMAAGLLVLLGGCATDRSLGERIDDAGIVARANAALAGSPVASAWEVDVDSRNGTVLLSGFVDTAEERREAERIVSQVDGVRRVENNIELKEDADR